MYKIGKWDCSELDSMCVGSIRLKVSGSPYPSPYMQSYWWVKVGFSCWRSFKYKFWSCFKFKVSKFNFLPLHSVLKWKIYFGYLYLLSRTCERYNISIMPYSSVRRMMPFVSRSWMENFWYGFVQNNLHKIVHKLRLLVPTLSLILFCLSSAQVRTIYGSVSALNSRTRYEV